MLSCGVKMKMSNEIKNQLDTYNLVVKFDGRLKLNQSNVTICYTNWSSRGRIRNSLFTHLILNVFNIKWASNPVSLPHISNTFFAFNTFNNHSYSTSLHSTTHCSNTGIPAYDWIETRREGTVSSISYFWMWKIMKKNEINKKLN